MLEECITNVEGCRRYIDKLKPHLHCFDFSEELQCKIHETMLNLKLDFPNDNTFEVTFKVK